MRKTPEKKPEQKKGRYELRATPNVKYHFLHIDPDDPKAPKPITMDMTEDEVRGHFHKAGWSDADIDERLQELRERLKKS
jgi:hypothetical protein